MKAYLEKKVLTKQLRALPKHQRTFETPLQALEPFVTTIVESVSEMDSAVLVVHAYTFEPKNMARKIVEYGSEVQVQSGLVLELESNIEIRKMLQAALSDWVDFVFVSQPKLVCMYADHDERATFYGSSKSNLNVAVRPLLKNGISEVDEYIREF